MERDTSQTPLPRRGAIMLMGITGSGKSTFIASLTDEKSRVGKSLESCTKICEAIEYQGDNHYDTIFLIDTPGFDDTSRSETEILREIAGALQVLTNLRVDLYGIIYLHRITDPRVSGAAMKSLRVLEKICGDEAYRNVFLVTTMWNRLEDTEGGDKIGEDREAGLCEKPFWGTLREEGAMAMRLSTRNKSSDTKESLNQKGAMAEKLGGPNKLPSSIEPQIMNEKEIVRIVSLHTPIPLLIQKEMNESREIRYLGNTSAGLYLEENMNALQRRHEKDLAALHKELEDAAKENDKETMISVKEDLERSIKETEKVEEQRRVLRSTKSSPIGVTPSKLLQQPLGTTTSIPNPASEESRLSRKPVPVPVTADILNSKFKDLRDGYNSSVSKRGGGPSGASDLRPSSNMGKPPPPPRPATSGSPKSGDNDTPEEQKSPDESKHKGTSNQQSPKIVPKEVQSAGTQTGALSGCDKIEAPAPASGTSDPGKFGITSGIVEGRKKLFDLLRKKPTSGEDHQYDKTLAVPAAQVAMSSKVKTGAVGK
ncbi:uncharacterized protein PAC_15895 [Phialocephala subalpina]|uniref:AIG1-type G domain-containing protein n=1 Tax=Phialocephala subalpina TaxID=576137 RepID=A0A1L7XLR9_9HELO|nr:uncharacterized protein PAC_15895 [Phialocephala subalpina]